MGTSYRSRQIHGSLRGEALKWFDMLAITKKHSTEGETLRYIVENFREYEHIINGIKAGKLQVIAQPTINIRTEH